MERKIVFVLFVVLIFAGSVCAQSANFGVNPPMYSSTTEAPTPTIASERTAEGYIPIGPDSVLVPAPVRGFEAGNGKEASFGVVQPPATPKVN